MGIHRHTTTTGPLAHLEVLEMAGLGPCPLAGQLLADLGARVTVIDRQSESLDVTDINRRGKRSIALDLKNERATELVHQLLATSDVLIEGYRPGVMERLGLGPSEAHAINPRLVYGRITGWGQDGPLSGTAGHDINYLAITGALASIGTHSSGPIPPLNLVADYGGGTMYLVLGVLAALHERKRSGLGQTIDAAMIDGVPAMMGLLHQWHANGEWNTALESNLLDGSAPFYRCYQTSDALYMAVGALETDFFKRLVEQLALPPVLVAEQYVRECWPEHTRLISGAFLSQTQAYWTEHLSNSDACVAPVLSLESAPLHPQNRHRSVFKRIDGVMQAAAAPRFSRSVADPPSGVSAKGQHATDVLQELGLSEEAIADLLQSGVVT